MNKERIKTNIILLLILLILIGSIVLVKGKVSEEIEKGKEESYSIGFNDGQINFYNQLIISLSQNGEVILPIQTNNQTVNVRLVVENER